MTSSEGLTSNSNGVSAPKSSSSVAEWQENASSTAAAPGATSDVVKSQTAAGQMLTAGQIPAALPTAGAETTGGVGQIPGASPNGGFPMSPVPGLGQKPMPMSSELMMPHNWPYPMNLLYAQNAYMMCSAEIARWQSMLTDLNMLASHLEWERRADERRANREWDKRIEKRLLEQVAKKTRESRDSPADEVKNLVNTIRKLRNGNLNGMTTVTIQRVNEKGEAIDDISTKNDVIRVKQVVRTKKAEESVALTGTSAASSGSKSPGDNHKKTAPAHVAAGHPEGAGLGLNDQENRPARVIAEDGNRVLGEDGHPPNTEETSDHLLAEGSAYVKHLDDKKKSDQRMTDQEFRDYKKLRRLRKQRNRQPWWRQTRIGAILKIALIMILLEVKLGWFIVYFVAIVLYMLGYLDWLVEWVKQNQKKYPALIEQITMLKSMQEERANWERQKRIELELQKTEEEIEKVKKEAARAAGDEEPDDHKSDSEKTRDEKKDGESSDNSATDREKTDTFDKNATDTSDKKSSDESKEKTDGNGKMTDEEKKKKEAKEKEPTDLLAEAQASPRYRAMCFYQLVFCFWMTLMPSWNPNPEMLGLPVDEEKKVGRRARPAE